MVGVYFQNSMKVSQLTDLISDFKNHFE